MIGYVPFNQDDYRADLEVLSVISQYLPDDINENLSLAIANTIWEQIYNGGLQPVKTNIVGYPINMVDLEQVVNQFSNSLAEIGG